MGEFRIVHVELSASLQRICRVNVMFLIELIIQTPERSSFSLGVQNTLEDWAFWIIPWNTEAHILAF